MGAKCSGVDERGWVGLQSSRVGGKWYLGGGLTCGLTTGFNTRGFCLGLEMGQGGFGGFY